MIDEKKLIEELEKQIVTITTPDDPEIRTKYWNAGISYAINCIEKQPKVGEWIPFKEREADDEERVVYGCDAMLECKLPDEDEDILVTHASGRVGFDTFLREGYECCLESGTQFISEAIAWMPLPKPYRGDEE